MTKTRTSPHPTLENTVFHLTSCSVP
jgi:hypothetical protein